MAEGNTAASEARQGPKVPTQRLCRGRRAGHAHKGCPGTWEVSRFLPKEPARGPGQAETPGPRGRARRDGSQDRALRKYGRAKATKQGRTRRETSECRSRSEEAGEPTRGTPRSKGRHRDTGPLEGKMAEPQSSVDVSTKLERVAKQAREAPDMAFRSLAHLIDIDWLREAYRRTRKDGARGVDGQSADEYAVKLEA